MSVGADMENTLPYMHRVSGQKGFHPFRVGVGPHQLLLECTNASEGQLPVGVQAVTARLAAPVMRACPDRAFKTFHYAVHVVAH